MLLDSNIIVYACRPELSALRHFIAEQNPSVSAISYVETLGYHKLRDEERQYLERFFRAARVLPISRPVLDHAVALRQQRKVSLGDAIIAGTALAYGLSLVTHNTSDFAWIAGLSVVDPLGAD